MGVYRLIQILNMFSLEEIQHKNIIRTSDVYQKNYPHKLKPGTMRGLFRFPFLAVWTLIAGMRPGRWFPGRYKIAFFCQSKNNYNTLRPVQETMPQSFLLQAMPEIWADGYILPTGIGYILAILFLPLAIYHMYRSKGKYRIAYRAFFDKYWRTYGLIVAYEFYLSLLSPKALVLSNDHGREHLIISSACNRRKIPVFFIPHGSFSRETIQNSPMKIDFALLSGEDQKNKINSLPASCKTFVIGRPVSDRAINMRNRSNTTDKVGVCVNPMDDFGQIEKLCRLIRSETDFDILLRPHPALSKSAVQGHLSITKEICFSDSIREEAIVFLSKVDAIIASCSSIVLDAAEMNVYSIFYDSTKRYRDYNDFVKNGVAEFAASSQDCTRLLKKAAEKKPNVLLKAKYYNETIGTAHEGKSSGLAREVILNNLKNSGSP